MRKGEIVAGSLSGLSFLAAFDAYAGTGTSSWLADLCLTGNAPPPDRMEGMPMEDHTQHAAYFASAGLSFLAVALGWEFAEAKLARALSGEPTGLARKRLLAVIIYVTAACEKPKKSAALQFFYDLTGHVLPGEEADSAYAYLMRPGAPELDRILAGASKRERRQLLRAAVWTWSGCGMDSDQSTRVTECIVSLLGFDQDDICKTLDRLWFEKRVRSGLVVVCRTTVRVLKTAFRLVARAARASYDIVMPFAVQSGRRMLTMIQSRHLPLSR
jgi:hypothetical protein